MTQNNQQQQGGQQAPPNDFAPVDDMPAAAPAQVPATQAQDPAGVPANMGTQEWNRAGELAAIAQGEQARAAIQSRYQVALARPRDWDTVRARLMKECARPGFAEVARYHKPIGKGVEGLSIRFAEAALRCMTNVLIESQVIYDDADKRQIRVSVTDLEANITYPIDVMVTKTVERSSIPAGETALSVRTNSKGQKTYTLRATEDDLLNKQNAQVSKAIRTSGLRLIPGDIQDEAEAAILATLRNRDKSDPDAAKKRVLDSFARLNIFPDAIKEYLGHPVEQVTPKELETLRALYTAMKDGEASWAEAMEKAASSRAIKTPQAKAAPAEKGAAGGK